MSACAGPCSRARIPRIALFLVLSGPRLLFGASVLAFFTDPESLPPESFGALLERNGLERVGLLSRPPERALRRAERQPDRIWPLYDPDWRWGLPEWSDHPELLDRVRIAVQKHPYRGLGVLDLTEASARTWRENPIFRGLLAIAGAYDLPFFIRIHGTSVAPALALCRNNPGDRLVLVGAETRLPPSAVARLLQDCGMVWIALSETPSRWTPEVRDWNALILRVPNRFVIGWEGTPETLGGFLGALSRWGSAVPPSVREALFRENASRLFRSRFQPPPTNDTFPKRGRND